MEVLESLGEETMQAILWQMGTKGVKFSSDSFDINIFATQLQDLFGDGAESLLEEIYQNILCRIELESHSTPDRFALLDGKKLGGRSSSALHKIQTMFGYEEKMSRDNENLGDGEENEK